MKAVILAGGYGTRISEETHLKPKPMIEIGGKPILWHIMKIYSHHGVNDFIICCGYKGYIIKEYFSNYFLHMSDVTFNLKENEMKVHCKRAEPWSITLIDTGQDSMTGGRLKKVEQYLDQDEDFCFTYGDGVSDINITEMIKFHNKQKTLATVTAVYLEGKFGALTVDNNKVSDFNEKPKGDGRRINGGFFILSPKVLNLIESYDTVWEQYPVQELARRGEMSCFKHNGFWQPMDTLNDKCKLEDLWDSGSAPWKVWE
jgi:glucose-1-phosphate cytidylyltransferase